MRMKKLFIFCEKLYPNAKLPERQSEEAAGLDLHAYLKDDEDKIIIYPGFYRIVPCGFAMALPKGHEAQIRPRSGIAINHGVTVLNSPGTVDSDYRGEIKVILINHGKNNFVIQHQDRIAQMVITKIASNTVLAEVKEGTLEKTARSINGFGSTGK